MGNVLIRFAAACVALMCGVASADLASLYGPFVPGAKVSLSVPELVGYGAKGLPSGLKLNKKTGEISGAAKKPADVSVTFAKKDAPTLTAQFVVGPIPMLRVALAGDIEKCKVTGADKAYLVGKKVSLAARSPKGTAFLGWTRNGVAWPNDDECRNAKLRYVMTEESLDLVATFERERMAIDASALANAALRAGTSVAEGEIVIAVETQSGLKTLKASKLPSGLKLKKDKATGVWSVFGKPKKAGAFEVVLKAAAMSGAVETTTVTVAVVSESEPLPEPGPSLGDVQLWEGGPYWSQCNVGATKPEEYGYYFLWGDTVGYRFESGAWSEDMYYNASWTSSSGTQMRISPFDTDEWKCPTFRKSIAQLQSAGYIDSTGNLVAAHDAATARCGAPWRMPTDAELDGLLKNCDNSWTTLNGVNGRLVKGRGAFASKSIFLPAAGYGSRIDYYYPGSSGAYWTSTPNPDNFERAWSLYFTAWGSWSFVRDYDNAYRFHGRSIRPVRDPAQ